MKKIFKILGYGLAGFLLILCLSAFYINAKGVPTFKYAPSAAVAELKVPKGDTALIERGQKIASMLCKDCHLSADGKMIGREITDMPSAFGRYYSGNLTSDSIHGIGGWTDGEIYYFLRTGIRKDGSWSPPLMPKYMHLADRDVQSIIAWLRSGDPSLIADPRTYLPNKWNFTVKALTNTLFTAPPMPELPIALPDTSDKVAWGKYLADDLFGCFACHSADIVKIDMMNPSLSAGYYGGGQILKSAEGRPVLSANLTPHPEFGIGKLTTDEFIRAVKYGQKPGGGTLSNPMPPFAGLSDSEVGAIHAFLKTVPIIANQVNRLKDDK